MTAKVNLLPQTTRDEGRQSTQRIVALGLIVLVIAGLGVAAWLQRGTLSDAEDDLQVAQAELAEAQAAVAALSMPADLEQRLDTDRQLITQALGEQVSVAGILQDVAMVIPPGSDIGTLSITLPPAEPVAEGEEAPPPITNVGSLIATGESLENIAPGIERLMLQFERPAGFRDVFVTSAATDDEDITSYNLELQMGPEHRTERYVDGVPEVAR